MGGHLFSGAPWPLTCLLVVLSLTLSLHSPTTEGLTEQPQGTILPGDPTAQLQRKVDEFEEWLAGRGLKLGGPNGLPLKLKVGGVQEGVEGHQARPQISLVASKSISKGDSIVRFFRDNIVHSVGLPAPYTPEHGGAGGGADLEEEEGEAEEGGSWRDYSTLCAWILRERAKGKSSDWAPYIAILPEYVPLTMFFQESTMQLLEDERLVSDTTAWRQLVEAEYWKCDPTAIANATKEDFMWAMSIVMSRAYGSFLPIDGVIEEDEEEELHVDDSDSFHGPAVLVPLADLANHANDFNWKRFSSKRGVATGDPEGGFAFRATTAVGAGDEILAEYGRHGNKDLMLVYGFVMDHNQDEHVLIAQTIEDTVVWFEEHLLQDGLHGQAERDAAELVQAAQKAVEDAWAALNYKYKVQVLELAEEELSSVDKERAHLFSTRHQYSMLPLEGEVEEEGRLLAVWPQGHIDPRLLAALAALSFFSPELQRGRPISLGSLDISVLANASINYGWGWVKGPCESLVTRMGPAYARAMMIAGGILQDQLKLVLRQFTSRLSADRKCLASVESCGTEEIQMDESDADFAEKRERLSKRCVGELLVRRGVPRHEVIMALKHRIQRKEILQRVLDRLGVSCGAAMEEDSLA